MNSKKIILVTGTAGKLGYSVAKALLAQKNFAVRILASDPSDANTLKLQQLGAEISEGCLENTESLKAAMQNCYGVFGITGFSVPVDNEYQQGKNLADLVKEMHIRHFIFSSLDDCYSLSNGEFPVPHYDVKAALKKYIKRLGIPASFAQVATSYDSFFNYFALQKDEYNNLYFAIPMGDIPFTLVNPSDYGGIVAAMFNHPAEYTGRTVNAVGANKSGHEYAAILSEALEETIYYKHVSREAFANNEAEDAAELANLFEVQRVFNPGRQLDLIESYGLNPATQRFEDWVKEHIPAFQSRLKELSVKAKAGMI